MIDFNIPLGALNRAASSLEQTASRVAKIGSSEGDTVDLSAEMVALIQARSSFDTNAKVIQTEGDLFKSLLNVLA